MGRQNRGEQDDREQHEATRENEQRQEESTQRKPSSSWNVLAQAGQFRVMASRSAELTDCL